MNITQYWIYNESSTNIIFKWFDRWREEKSDYFDKFIYLWISFNSFYNTLTTNNKWLTEDYTKFLKSVNRYDWDKSQVLYISKYFVEILKSIEKKEIFEYHKLLIDREHPWFDDQVYKKWGVINLRYWELVEYKNLNSTEDFLLTLYTIRNNLFHWWKNPEYNFNQELVLSAANALEEFLTYIYNIQ